MERKAHPFIANLFFALGIIAAVYVGAYFMFAKPVYLLIIGFINQTLTVKYIIGMAIRIFFSGTVFGLLWCIGYVIRNHFMGTLEPDWSLYDAKKKEQEEPKD